MALDISNLIPEMLKAAQAAVGDRWMDVKDYAESEFGKIASSIATIGLLRAQGKLTEEQAQLHLNMQKNASRAVLLTVEGMSILLAERALNAALGVVRDFVNGVLGFRLIDDAR